MSGRINLSLLTILLIFSSCANLPSNSATPMILRWRLNENDEFLIKWVVSVQSDVLKGDLVPKQKLLYKNDFTEQIVAKAVVKEVKDDYFVIELTLKKFNSNGILMGRKSSIIFHEGSLKELYYEDSEPSVHELEKFENDLNTPAKLMLHSNGAVEVSGAWIGADIVVHLNLGPRLSDDAVVSGQNWDSDVLISLQPVKKVLKLSLKGGSISSRKGHRCIDISGSGKYDFTQMNYDNEISISVNGCYDVDVCRMLSSSCTQKLKQSLVLPGTDEQVEIEMRVDQSHEIID